ncbi:haloacid dehalogenase, partial [Streptomyces sp. W16]|nr:haloacid dehalogenase [Streptomyces sp. W16]
MTKPPRLLLPLLAAALLLPPPPASAAPRPRDDCGARGWAPSATRIDPADTYHPYVGNGYLGTRVPPAGAGYAASGEKTGWPLYTPRYDGAFVSGLYARGPANTAGREVLAALPTWTGLDVTAGSETYGSGSRITRYRQTLNLRCGHVRTSLTWTTKDGRRTDLVYDVLTSRDAQHTGAVHLRVTPHWDGELTLTDRLDGRGVRRVTQTDGGPVGAHTIGVAFRTDGTGVDGALASVLDAPSHRQHAARDGKLSASQTAVLPVRSGRTYTATKFVGVDTSLTSRDPRAAAQDAAGRA